MISVKEKEDGFLVLDYDGKIFACPVLVRDQIVCLAGKSPDEAIENAKRFLDHEDGLKNRAKDLMEQAWMCEKSNLLERAEALRARAKRLYPGLDCND